MREHHPIPSPEGAYHRRQHAQSTSLTPGAPESSLLQQIRSIISPSPTSSAPRSTSSRSTSSTLAKETLTWFDKTVLYTEGVTLLRQWNFAHEGDEGVVRHVCWAWFTVPVPASTEQDSVPVSVERDEKETVQTFGAFHHVPGQHQREHSGPTSTIGLQTWKHLTMQRGVCIFLRDICRVFLPSGDEYTVNLPFLVNSAWPMYPSGLIVQREFDPSEKLDPDRLPTIYSLSHPLDELRPIPVVSPYMGYIFYGRYVFDDRNWRISAGPPPARKANLDQATTLGPEDRLLWIADRTEVPDPIAISHNASQRSLGIWLLLSAADEHAVDPTPAAEPPEHHKHNVDRRKSKKGLGGPLGPGDRDRRVSSVRPSDAAEGRNAMRVFSTSKAPVDARTVQAAAAATRPSQNGDSRYPQLRPSQDPFVALPGASLPVPIQSESPEEDKMEPERYLKKLLTIEGIQDIDPHRLSIHMFDIRETRSLLAILMPSNEVLLYEIQRHADYLTVHKRPSIFAFCIASMCISRTDIYDLVTVGLDGSVNVVLAEDAILNFRITYRKANSEDEISYDIRLVEPDDMWEADEVHARDIQDPGGNSLTFTLEDEQRVRLELDLMPRDALTRSSLEAIYHVLPQRESFGLFRRWLKDRRHSSNNVDDFDCLSNVLLDVFLPDFKPYQRLSRAPQTEETSWNHLADSSAYGVMIQDPCLRSLRQCSPRLTGYQPTPATTAPSPYVAPILLALHLLAEDYKTHTNKFDELQRLVRLVLPFAMVAQRDWWQYWLRECPSVADANSLTSEALRSATVDRRLDFPPPDLMSYLGSYFGHESTQPYFVVHQVGKLFGLKVSSLMGVADPCPRSSMLLELYSALRSSQNGILHISQTVHLMSMYRLGPDVLNTIPLGIALPLWEALRKTRYRPPSTAPPRFYQLSGRNDLSVTLFGPDRRVTKSENYHQRNEPNQDPQQSIVKHYGEAYVSLAGRAKEETTGVGDPRVRYFTDVRFPEDYRLREVETMLRSSRICVIRVQDRPDASDHDLANEHQMLIMRIAERTLSLPFGRAALTFATVPTAQADSYALPPLEFSVKILPQGSVLNLDGARLTDDVRFWTEFNNAVAAALRIAPASEGVDYSWIILLNKPPELSSKHAGFIFGLGLSGHLRSMLPFQAFGYLAPKHNFTTIAVLLGLAAAHCGTGNETVTQMISVHTPALLPPNSAELNIPVLTQAAGLVGLGLLYLGTRNRRMARVTLKEISRKDLVKPGQTDEHRESYALSAGFAFGFIMVGKGAQSNPADMAMVQELQSLIHGEVPSIDQSKYQKPNFDVTITAPAAIVALMLMFMRTERQDIADLLRPPKTREELTHYAPYLIMLRTIARSVIMWHSISLKVEWLYANLPDFLARLLRNAPNAGHALAQLDDASSLAYMYTIAGLCFGIGLRYVGSAEPEALARLSMLHDAANKAMALSITGYDQRIKRFAYKECVGAIQVAMAMVAAGTGELSIFQRLRIAHGQYNNVRYGTHVATHLSLGLLFLGNGRYTLGNSNAAIACLIASLYPRFPNTAADNRAHPQMLRHLWVLATEPRCLITRDVDSGKIVGLPVRLRKRDRDVDSSLRVMAPSLLPEIDKIISLEVDSPRYSPLSLDIMNNVRHRASMIRDQTMWVKRQPGFLTYEEDIRGTRNINLHTNVAYLDALPLDFPSGLPLEPEVTEHLFSFMNSSTHFMRTVGFAKYLCRQAGTTPRENALFGFAHAALVECLALDKINMLDTYLSVFLSRYDHPSDTEDAVIVVRSLRAAANFYEAQFSRFKDEGLSINRSVTLRPTLLQNALSEAEKIADGLSLDPTFRAALRAYVRGEGITPATPSEGDALLLDEPSMQDEDEEMEEVDEDVLARELAFFLTVFNFPSLKVLLSARAHAKQASDAFRQMPGGQEQFPSWMAIILLKAATKMGGDRQLPNEVITTRAVEEILKAWAR